MSSDVTETIVDTDMSIDVCQSLQPNVMATQRSRPPNMHIHIQNDADSRVPLRLHRRQSKTSLRGIFSRNRVEKSLVSPVQEEGGLLSAQFRLGATNEPDHNNFEGPTNDTAAIPSGSVTPRTPSGKPSRMNLRSGKESKPPAKAIRRASPRISPKAHSRTVAILDPLPLFQAYPQAIKHAQLSASRLSTDAILRISQQKKPSSSSTREEIEQTDVACSKGAKKSEKVRIKHRRHASGSISSAGWTQKIYILVTSGYILQYSGEGAFDRLPEKMLQLGKDSVAFASDVIPGKHWVLQISQAMDTKGTPTADSRSLLSRLSFRGTEYKRAANSALLILESAEDMDAWLATVRKEITALGGKKQLSETGKPKLNGNNLQLDAQPNHQILAARTSNPPSPIGTTFLGRDQDIQEELERASSALARSHSFSCPLTGHDSSTNSFVSYDGSQLDYLRHSNARLSYMSSGQRTLLTSHTSSSSPSPTRESHSTSEDVPRSSTGEDTMPTRPNAHVLNGYRRSMQTTHVPTLEIHPKSLRPQSALGAPLRPDRSHSPPMTPNFSIPFASPQRSATQKLPSSHQKIPILSTVRLGKNLPQSDKRSPPAALKARRPLSTVDDISFAELSPPLSNPSEASSDPQGDAPTNNTYDESPIRPEASATNLPLLQTMLPFSKPEEAVVLNFNLPRRPSHKHGSSIQDLNKAVRYPSILRSSHIPPAALQRPLPSSPPQASGRVRSKVVGGKENEEIFSSSTTTNKHKSFRPTSMQVHPAPQSPAVTTLKLVRSRSSSAMNSTKNPRAGAKSPSGSRLNVPDKSLGNRRSMPSLPPPAPPPNCALPPLPPSRGEMGSSARLSVAIKF